MPNTHVKNSQNQFSGLLIIESIHMMVDSAKRSLIKSISWRFIGSGSTFLIAWGLTGDYIVAGPIASIQLVANTVLYYCHERLWSKVKAFE